MPPKPATLDDLPEHIRMALEAHARAVQAWAERYDDDRRRLSASFHENRDHEIRYMRSLPGVTDSIISQLTGLAPRTIRHIAHRKDT